MEAMKNRGDWRGGVFGLIALVLVLAWPAVVASAQDRPRPVAVTRQGVFQAQSQDEQPADEAGEGAEGGGAAPEVELTGTPEDPMVTFSETAEPMELAALVDLVASTLGINVSVRGELRGTVLFNTTRSVPLSRLLPLLDAMLEQHDFSITFDGESGFYLVQPKANIPVTFDGGGNEFASTRLIEIPTIKPSSLSEAIGQIMGGGGAGGAPSGVSYLDELGLIIITSTPRQIARVEALIERVLARLDKMSLTPIELRYISAPAARDRLIALVGGTPEDSGSQAIARQLRQQGQQGQPGGIGPTSGGTIENLAERLSVDPQSNALLFRGTADELERVTRLVGLIDVMNQLQARRHFVGTAARQVAEFARQRGLGEVILLDDTTGTQNQFGVGRNIQQAGIPGQFQDTETVAGPTLVVDVRNGEIVYYGTEDQQATLEEMIDTLDTEADRVVIRQYRLHHAKAEEVAEVIQSLLTGETGLGQNTLLPQSRGQQAQIVQPVAPQGGGGDGEIGEFDPTRVFVVPDVANNQIIVKAPVKQQEDFAQLVERLDLRRRQVYIEALIVSVSDTDGFRFALETQFQIGQYRGQTNFGLSEAGDSFIDRRDPISTLSGLTTALIKTQYLPFVINTIKNETDARVLSRPQLLVNDNEEATVASIEQQPTTSQSQGTNSTITSFQGYEDAGTTLTVTPGISEAGFLRLEYSVEFSSFTGSGSEGVPPPRLNQNVNGSVTMPSDATIVVGGITVDTTRDTVVKVPLLGDIPLIGPLFADTNKTSSSTLLYIFITPKILLDPDFRDLRLLTKGPQFAADVEVDLPELEPVAIDRITPGRNGD